MNALEINAINCICRTSVFYNVVSNKYQNRIHFVTQHIYRANDHHLACVNDIILQPNVSEQHAQMIGALFDSVEKKIQFQLQFKSLFH